MKKSSSSSSSSSSSLSSRKNCNNPCFRGFVAGTAVACFVAVYFGMVILPGMEDRLHSQDHDRLHNKYNDNDNNNQGRVRVRGPSFDAPHNLLLRRKQAQANEKAKAKEHNSLHKHEFENAYHMPDPKVLAREIEIAENENKNANNNNNNNSNNNNSNDAKRRRNESKPRTDNNDNDNDNNNDNDNDNDENQKYHVVFSTSCSPFQNWQSLAFFYFARKVRQPGTVTRLVSGCTDEQSAELKRVHEHRVVPMAIHGLQTFEMHVTPAFDDSGGGDRKYWNKPNGLLHWMEESLGFDGKSDHEQDDAIVILVDPDMMLLRPITANLSPNNYRGGWTESANTRKNEKDGRDPFHNDNNDSSDSSDNSDGDSVRHGRPYAQRYGFGSAWVESLSGRLNEVVPPGSPALDVSLDDAEDYYPAGPPYIVTAKDMYKIAVHWVEFLPKVFSIFDGFMCEMHAYSIAAAHLRLPHKLARGFIVSDVEAGTDGENFDFIDDNMTKKNVCMAPPDWFQQSQSHQLQQSYRYDPTDASKLVDPLYAERGIGARDLPFVLHYCQRYALGRYFFSKYKLPEPVFDDCSSPMLLEPPSNVAELYDWNLFPNGIEMNDFAAFEVRDHDNGNNNNAVGSSQQDSWKAKIFSHRHLTNGWMLCAIILGINEAIGAYRREICGTPEQHPEAYQKTFHFHDEELFRKSIENPAIPRDIFDAAAAAAKKKKKR